MYISTQQQWKHSLFLHFFPGRLHRFPAFWWCWNVSSSQRRPRHLVNFHPRNGEEWGWMVGWWIPMGLNCLPPRELTYPRDMLIPWRVPTWLVYTYGSYIIDQTCWYIFGCFFCFFFNSTLDFLKVFFYPLHPSKSPLNKPPFGEYVFVQPPSANLSD